MPKIVDHEKYRYEILRDSFDLIATRGFAEITIREIAKELDISSGTLYHYFRNKKELLQEMIRSVSRHEMNLAIGKVSKGESLDVKVALLINFIRERIQFLHNFFLITIDYHRHFTEEDDRIFIKEFNQFISGSLAKNLNISYNNGQLIFTHLSGIMYQSLIYRETVDYDQQLADLKEIIVHCIRTGYGGTGRGKK